MELLERASQAQALNSALAQTSVGEGCIALVYGEAGIGKTSLVEHFVNENKKTRRILSGACDSLFTPRPLGPLRDIALQTRGNLLDLLNVESNREAIFSACLSELKDPSTILVMEDVHWADEATLDLLKYLGRRIRQTPSLMVLTYRDDELDADHPLRILLGDLASSHALHHVPVSPLSKDAVSELAKNKHIDSVELHRLTNGNPFFVTEVLAVEGGIPETVREAVLARAARLSPSARAVLEAAAVIGSRVEPWLLSKLSNSGNAEECIARGMLQLQGEYYAFRHELARQTILESISLQRKIVLHRMALNALKETPETRNDLARLANHAEGTKDAEAVLEYAPAAARQAAAAGAHRQAIALYELALQFADALPAPEHAHVLEAYADEGWFLGPMEAHIPMRREAIVRYHALGDRLREGRNLAMLASELHGLGRSAESEEAGRAAVAMLEALPPSAELAQAYRQQCFLLSEWLEYASCIVAGEKTIALAERFGDMDTLSRACNLTGYPLLLMGDERGESLMERSLAVAREHGLHYAIGLALGQWIGALMMIFQFEQAGRLLQEGIAYAAAHDDDNHLLGMLASQAQIHLYQGRWSEAADLTQGILQGPERGIITRADALRLLGRLGVRRGDAGAEQSLAEALASSMQANSLELAGIIKVALAEAAWLRGDNQKAIAQARVAYDRFAAQHVIWPTAELAFWRWRAGDDFTPPDWIAKPYALQIAGDWRGAAKEWEQRGCPYEQGMALMDGNEAAQLAALEIFERLGARPIIEKLKGQMRAQGISIPRGPRPATRENPFRLTSREMEILACLAKGLSNSAIAKQLSLSRRTVEHHIASILQKMQVRSRIEAVEAALKDNLLLSG